MYETIVYRKYVILDIVYIIMSDHDFDISDYFTGGSGINVKLKYDTMEINNLE